MYARARNRTKQGVAGGGGGGGGMGGWKKRADDPTIYGRPPQNPGPKTRTSFLMCVCGNKTYSFGPFSYQLYYMFYGFSCVRFTGYALCLHSLTHT